MVCLVCFLAADGSTQLYVKFPTSVWMLLEGQFNLSCGACPNMAQLITFRKLKNFSFWADLGL